jgi:hypothetical protein
MLMVELGIVVALHTDLALGAGDDRVVGWPQHPSFAGPSTGCVR